MSLEAANPRLFETNSKSHLVSLPVKLEYTVYEGAYVNLDENGFVYPTNVSYSFLGVALTTASNGDPVLVAQSGTITAVVTNNPDGIGSVVYVGGDDQLRADETSGEYTFHEFGKIQSIVSGQDNIYKIYFEGSNIRNIGIVAPTPTPTVLVSSSSIDGAKPNIYAGTNSFILGGAEASINLGDSSSEYAGSILPYLSENTAVSAINVGYFSTASISGEFTNAGATKINVSGDVLRREFIGVTLTQDETPAILQVGYQGVNVDNTALIPDFTAWTFIVTVSAKRVGSGEYLSRQIRGCIAKPSDDPADTVIVGTPVVDEIYTQADWDVSVSAGTSAGTLDVTVTGVSGATIYWVADFRIIQISTQY